MKTTNSGKSTSAIKPTLTREPERSESDAPVENAPPPQNTIMNFFRDWDRFFLSPLDPTLLGFVRICVGLIVLYVHFAYTEDLLDFVGPDAWVNGEMYTQLRR